MEFFMPTKVYNEKNVIRNHAREIALLGNKALIVTGKTSAKKCGALDDVISALKSQNIGCSLYSDIEENPSIETVMRARDFGISQGADFVIGIGGGSPMDAAKAIALMMKHGDKGPDYLYLKNADSSALPIVAIPTTCGTGSEVTGISVLTIHERKTKSGMPHTLFPTLSLIDSRYLTFAPIGIIRSTAMDALCHLIESEINSDANDFSRMLSDSGLKLFSKVKKCLLSGDISEGEYEYLLRMSTLAGMSIAHTGTSLPHGLSYTLTYSMGVPHGIACGTFLKGYLDASYENGADESVRKILTFTGFSSTDEINNFFENTCGKAETSNDILKAAVNQVFENKSKLEKAPFPVSYELLCAIAGVLE